MPELISRTDSSFMAPTHPNKEYDALVVLGKNWDKRAKRQGRDPLYRREPEFFLSRDSMLSTTAAAELYRQGRVGKIIFSTGQTLEGFPSEAQAMRDHLRHFYSDEEIPSGDILLEDTSIDTPGNAEQTLPLVKDIDPKKIALLTVGYHKKRAKRLFRKFGIKIPNNNALSSERVLGMGRSDPERPLIKTIKERAIEATLNTLLYFDPYGKLPRKLTSVTRK